MARFEDMLDDVRGAVYGAPDPILLRSLRRATQELCKYSQCWRETLDDTYAQDGVPEYEFLAPFGANVDRILWVKVDGRVLRHQARPEDVLGLAEGGPGFPRMFSQDSVRQELRLYPTPGPDEHNKVISIHAVLSTTSRSADLPDGLVDEYSQGIVAWAKWDLLMNSPGQPWHHPQNAQVQRGFADEIFARAKRTQHSGHSTPLTVQPRRFI